MGKGKESETTQAADTIKQPDKMSKMLANKEFYEYSIKQMEEQLNADEACSKGVYEEQLKCLSNYSNKFEDACVRIHSESKFTDDQLKEFMRKNNVIVSLCVKLKSLLREKIERCEDACKIESQSVVEKEKSVTQAVAQPPIEPKKQVNYKGFIFNGEVGD